MAKNFLAKPTITSAVVCVYLIEGLRNRGFFGCCFLTGPHARVHSRGQVIVLGVTIYVTLLRKNGLIAGLAKIDFFLEKASTKFKYCLRKI